MNNDLRTDIKPGQPFYDRPVHVEVSRATPTALLAAHLGGREIPAVIREVSHHERVQLQWMKPDGKGGLVPQ